MNGVYASGEVPEVGDLVECRKKGLNALVYGNRYSVASIGEGRHGGVRIEETNTTCHTDHLKLISRKEQPAVTPEQSPPLVNDSILIVDLQQAWKHATRAVNYCENADMNDTATAVREIVVKLSQQLEFHQSQSGVI